MGPEGLLSMENYSNCIIGDRTRDIPSCSAVPQISHTKNTELLYKDNLFKCDDGLLHGYLYFRGKKNFISVLRIKASITVMDNPKILLEVGTRPLQKLVTQNLCSKGSSY